MQQKFAIALTDYDGKPLYDPKYTRLIVRYETPDEFVDVPIRDCTEEDWAEFYELD